MQRVEAVPKHPLLKFVYRPEQRLGLQPHALDIL